MKRKEFISITTKIGCAALASSLFGNIKTNKKKPNVLFIAIDDLKPILGCYGDKYVVSPNLDKFAENGMIFTHNYCQQAVCSPSRTSLLTGLRPDSTKIYDLETHFRKTVPNVTTLPQIFKNNGYHSIGISKIYHGGLNDELSWSEPWIKPSGKSYYSDKNKSKEPVDPDDIYKKTKLTDKGLPFEAGDAPDIYYTDGTTTDMSINILNRIKNNPFFFAVGFLKPHLPFNCPKKYWDLYNPGKIELAPNPFAPNGAPKLALTNWNELRTYRGIPAQGAVPEETARKMIHGYYACTSFIDAQIGRILKELDSLDLSKNTIVIIWGDHGWHLGDHGLWCKHTNFESATRSLMMIRAPGMTAIGKKCDRLTEFVDIYPTLCDLAGIKLPSHLEGTSYAPLLNKPDQPWKKAAFSQYPRNYNKTKYMGYSMRTEDYRYTEWISKNNKTDFVEVYDHKNDTLENINQASNPEYASIVKSLKKQFESGWKAQKP